LVTRFVGRANRSRRISPKGSANNVNLRLSSNASSGWRWAQQTRCACGCDIAWISDTSMRALGRVGETNIKRSPKCSKGCIGGRGDRRIVLIPDACHLASGPVAERSVSLRRWLVRAAGGIGSENADMSSEKECEKHSRRKSKGSCARLIRAG